MARINLAKLISKKDLFLVLENLIYTLDISLTIKDCKDVILWGEPGDHCTCQYPIRAGDDIIGWVMGEDKIETIVALLNYLVAQEWEKKLLAQDTLEKYEEVNFLYDLGTKIYHCYGMSQIVQLLVEETTKLFAATDTTVMLLDEEQGVLKTVSLDHRKEERMETISAIKGIVGHVLRSGKAEIVNDVLSDSRYIKKGKNKIYSLICAPLKTHNQIIGAIEISNNQPTEYKAQDLKLFTALTSQAAVAIENYFLYEELKQYSLTLERKVAERTDALALANQELERLATLDGLTKVANRRKFDQYLQLQWEIMAQEEAPLGLILADVDYFKLYNDRYLHQAGDDCLQKIAVAICRAISHGEDLVARYGGEEFAVILPRTNKTNALMVAQAIRQEIESLKIPHDASKISSYVTMSLGVASVFPHQKSSPTYLIDLADRSLYQAKHQGRNRYCIASQCGL